MKSGLKKNRILENAHPRAHVFRRLMAKEIREILLISSAYNIFNIEEDGGLTERILNEYKNLNLNFPPRITGVSSPEEGLYLLKIKSYDMVIIAPQDGDMILYSLTSEIKQIKPDIQVILLIPHTAAKSPVAGDENKNGIDKVFVWSGNSDFLVSMIKHVEDNLNAEEDTLLGNVRVILLVEDSPEYYSYLLPIIYKEVIKQTQSLVDIRFNENERLITMRSRPKVLLATNHEEAMMLYRKYRPYLISVFSDVRMPVHGKIEADTGIRIISQIKNENQGLPLLLMSSESNNRKDAEKEEVSFLDKNAPDFLNSFKHFFYNELGFGDFVFKMPDGRKIDQASNLQQIENKLHNIPEQSIAYHFNNNHFSTWFMARSEIPLALKFRAQKSDDFKNTEILRQHLISNIHEFRITRQKGVITNFNCRHFDSDIRDFVKIGRGSLGGKARGLSYISTLLQNDYKLKKKYPEFNIRIPKALVICTDVFESFITQNNLSHFSGEGFPDEKTDEYFFNASLPESLIKMLKSYLIQVKSPLAIRSSSQLEDTQFYPFAGLYRTYMIPNNHSNLFIRLSHLIKAIQLVYASTYYEAPKKLLKNISKQPFNESMAVIIQELAGEKHGNYYYPSVSGVAQSYNYYPFSYMKPEEGVAHIALGLGKTVVEGERCLRFSPVYPDIIPEFSSTESILKNAQQSFYALRINNHPEPNFHRYTNLVKRNIERAENEFPVQTMTSTYLPEENRIRDSWHYPGPKVLTFSKLLKKNMSRFPELIHDLLETGQKGMGLPVEIEFSANLYPEKERKTDICFLQIRPMVADFNQSSVNITQQDLHAAFCYSSNAIGNGINDQISDIVYIKPDTFKPEQTVQMVEELNKINTSLTREKRPYLLIGPGRWGSSDRFLGIPVKWRHISGARAIVELRNAMLNSDPSQGSHFFHNITAQGVKYITINETQNRSAKDSADYLDWSWINSIPAASETQYTRHINLTNSLLMKIDGRKSQCVILKTGTCR